MLEVVLPIISGKLLKHFGFFQKEQEKVLINYVMYFALPILALKTGHQIKLGLEVIKVSFLAWASIVLCMSVAYIIARLYRLSNKDLRTFLWSPPLEIPPFGLPLCLYLLWTGGTTDRHHLRQFGFFSDGFLLGVMVASGKPDLRKFSSFLLPGLSPWLCL